MLRNLVQAGKRDVMRHKQYLLAGCLRKQTVSCDDCLGWIMIKPRMHDGRGDQGFSAIARVIIKATGPTVSHCWPRYISFSIKSIILRKRRDLNPRPRP